MSAPSPVIEVENLSKSFGPDQVLKGVDLSVPPGSTCVLLGVSGSGKTVLMKHLIGLLKPDRGSVRIEGEDLATLSQEQLDHVRRKMGILFQANALFDSMTIFENVAFPLRQHSEMEEEELQRVVREKLAMVGLEQTEQLYPAQLSGGMQKRVAFARAIAFNPKILLYDEPVAGLDPITAQSVGEIIITGRKMGATVLAIIADLPTAFRVADSMALLHEGRIVEHRPASEFPESTHPAVQAFLKTWLEVRDVDGY
jgi:phospholipid/cholesterol/gamma-HCH transport system ATP-binding protein